MANRPTERPEWAATENQTGSGLPTKVQPPTMVTDEGWEPGTRGVAPYDNYQKNLYSRWLQYLGDVALQFYPFADPNDATFDFGNDITLMGFASAFTSADVRLYAFNDDGTVVSSATGGRSWLTDTDLPAGSYKAVDNSNDGINNYQAAIGVGALNQVIRARANTQLVWTDPGVVFANDGQYIHYSPNLDRWLAGDSAQTYMSDSDDPRAGWSLLVAANSPAGGIAAVSSDDYTAVLRNPGGTSWQVHATTDGAAWFVAPAPTGDDTDQIFNLAKVGDGFLALTDQGAYYTSDFTSWTQRSSTLFSAGPEATAYPERYTAYDGEGTVMFMTNQTTGGVLATYDNGTTWGRRSFDITPLPIFFDDTRFIHSYRATPFARLTDAG